MANEIEQPKIRGGRTPGIPQYSAGAKRSVARLKNLDYDPIGELVAQHRKLEEELRYQEKLRSGEIVELLANGKPRSYRAEIHMSIYDKLIAIGDKLLRYGYGRVPETLQIEEIKPAPLVINLTKKGEQYVLNDEQPDYTDVEFAEDDETVEQRDERS